MTTRLFWVRDSVHAHSGPVLNSSSHDCARLLVTEPHSGLRVARGLPGAHGRLHPWRRGARRTRLARLRDRASSGLRCDNEQNNAIMVKKKKRHFEMVFCCAEKKRSNYWRNGGTTMEQRRSYYNDAMGKMLL